MKDIIKIVYENVFTFSTAMILIVAAFIFALVVTIDAENKREEQNRLLTEACYNQGMVPVDTEAGKRCATPQSLIKVK